MELTWSNGDAVIPHKDLAQAIRPSWFVHLVAVNWVLLGGLVILTANDAAFGRWVDMAIIVAVSSGIGAIVALALSQPGFAISVLPVILAYAVLLRWIPSLATTGLFGDSDAVFTYSALSSFSATGQYVYDGLTPTHSFPGLFNLYRQVEVMAGLSELSIAIWLHPVVNVLAVVGVAIAARRIGGDSAAILAASVMGLDFVAARLGGELRQEALALPLYTIVAWALVRSTKSSVPARFLVLLVSTGIVTIHMVTSVNLVILLAAYFVARSAARALGGPIHETLVGRPTSDISTVALVVILIVAFVLFLSSGATGGLVTTAAQLIRAILESEVRPTLGSEISYGHYGPLVAGAAWLFRAVLAASTIYMFGQFVRTRKAEYFLVSSLSAAYAASSVVSTVIPLGLNAFRFYHVLLVGGALVVAYGVARLAKVVASSAFMLAFVFVTLHFASTLLRYPAYVLPLVESARQTTALDDLRHGYTGPDLQVADIVRFVPISRCVITDRHGVLVFRGLARHRDTSNFDSTSNSEGCMMALSGPAAERAVSDRGIVYASGTWELATP